MVTPTPALCLRGVRVGGVIIPGVGVGTGVALPTGVGHFAKLIFESGAVSLLVRHLQPSPKEVVVGSYLNVKTTALRALHVLASYRDDIKTQKTHNQAGIARTWWWYTSVVGTA
ncbi:hypothetical protein Tco_1093182 [Tanacetum coccineum]|uniref:Uncharacterized protein n=1 Tax=Tanacetum coccineum TaxID=301880 RepID=A0ABQ5IDC1_9ASTR